MSRSSEEVLLIVNHVRQKKTDGTLYLMGERLAWMQEGKNTFAVSHLYADIKVQKISPEGKEKVQLQLVMHDGGANTFHFNNPEGRQAQVQDRDGVKEVLQQLLPKFKRKISSELEEKNKLLQEDPELFQLYKDLVVSQVVSAEEFWASRAHKFSNSNKNDFKQVIGVSPAFLADIKPQTDGCNGLKYNLTADIIESVFKTYPMVKRKHAEYVPHQMTESEFWTRFFQSHYFHRDRINIGNKDIFSECAKNDEEEMKDQINKNVTDPLVDLTRLKDYALDDEYRGVADDNRTSTNVTNLSMIKRFNHHSTMVLQACVSKTDSSAESSSKNCDANNKNNGGNATNSKHIPNGSQPALTASTSSYSLSDEPHRKKAKIREKIAYEDLNSARSTNLVNLRLGKMERYLHGPTPVVASRYTTSETIAQSLHSVGEEIAHWSSDLSSVLSGGQAVGVLGELSPGGALMHGTSQQQLHQMVPSDIQAEVHQHYSAICELLRHFWSCFPTSSKFLEEKVVKMQSTLQRFQQAKLNPLKEKLNRNHYSIDLTAHMEDMLSAAYSKFDSWQAKKMAKR